MSVHFLGLLSRFTFLVSQLTATVAFKYGQAWMYSQLTIKKTRQIKIRLPILSFICFFTPALISKL